LGLEPYPGKVQEEVVDQKVIYLSLLVGKVGKFFQAFIQFPN
jgi:hypothetical protein